MSNDYFQDSDIRAWSLEKYEDERGSFSKIFVNSNQSQIQSLKEMSFVRNTQVGILRGLHFQLPQSLDICAIHGPENSFLS